MTTPTWFGGFDDERHEVEPGVRLRVRRGGRAGTPPLLLLHGFPQTSALWHRVARRLAPHFRLVLPDLRGYGDSDKPADGPGHAPHSKRRMAADVHALMRRLGHERYHVAGHDRGGRVAHRLALDEPQAVQRLALLDIAPTLDMYESTDMRFASAYYHWFFLIQPAPFPEHLIGRDPEHFLRHTLGGWGAQRHRFWEPEALAEYLRCWSNPATIHAACEDYRASAGIDLEHDRASREGSARIGCDTLVLVGERGVIHSLFDAERLWRAQCAAGLRVQALPCGHFMPEEQPDAVAERLLAFFGA
jgi:haloacetate dehalogenase